MYHKPPTKRSVLKAAKAAGPAGFTLNESDPFVNEKFDICEELARSQDLTQLGTMYFYNRPRFFFPWRIVSFIVLIAAIIAALYLAKR